MPNAPEGRGESGFPCDGRERAGGRRLFPLRALLADADGLKSQRGRSIRLSSAQLINRRPERGNKEKDGKPTARLKASWNPRTFGGRSKGAQKFKSKFLHSQPSNLPKSRRNKEKCGILRATSPCSISGRGH